MVMLKLNRTHGLRTHKMESRVAKSPNLCRNADNKKPGSVLERDPALLLRTVTLPVHEAQETTSLTADIPQTVYQVSTSQESRESGADMWELMVCSFQGNGWLQDVFQKVFHRLYVN